MSATALGALATAGVLGVTHGLEPDHLAGIAALTGRYDDSRLSALVGGCFGAGHVALVVAWLTAITLLVQGTSVPPIFDSLGTVAVVVALVAFGGLLAVQGARATARSHANRVPHDSPSPPHLHLPLVGSAADHDHTTRAYLRTGLVGALFTLSPPLSMIAFLGTVVPWGGTPMAVLAVGVYAVTITATMALLGAGLGSAVSLARRHGRSLGVARVVAGLVVVGFGLAVAAGV
jgi:hypothetical protein